MRNRCHKLAVVFGLFLLIPGVLLAQTTRELRPGSRVNGNIGAGEEHRFSVRAAGAGFITVETSGDLDTYLNAFDSADEYIGADDDGGDGYNARLEIFAEAGRTYYFALTCYDESQSGPYGIMASFEALPPDTARNTERSRAVSLQAGRQVDVIFRAASESRWYRCDIPGANRILQAHTTGNLITHIAFYDSRGNKIDENTFGMYGNARLSSPVDSGAVFIEVKTESGQGKSILYTELRERPMPDQYEPDDSRAAAKNIAVGDRQSRTFTDAADEDWVRLQITRAGVYEIRFTAESDADGPDSYLELYDANGNLIHEDDDSGGERNALIRARLNPGVYYIKARCYMAYAGTMLIEFGNNRYILSVQAVQ